MTEQTILVFADTYYARLDLYFRSKQAARWQDVLERIAGSLKPAK